MKFGGGLLMPKDLNISLLCDFYGDLLTQKQKETILLYYNEDLSLSEIAEELSISRQGARDNIQRGEEKLLAFEAALKVVEKTTKLSRAIDNMQVILSHIKAADLKEKSEDLRKLDMLAEKMQNILD